MATCITNTITLIPGQSFILPPGATIVSASDVESITSDCTDLSNIETFTCYGVALAANHSDGDGHSEFFEKDNQRVIGFWLDGSYTAFSSPVVNDGSYGFYDMNAVLARLIEKIPGIIAGNSGPGSYDDDNGTRSTLVIKTIPSIGTKLQLAVNTSAPSLEVATGGFPSSTNSNTDYRADFRLLSSLTGESYNDFGTCP